ncbi:MAG: pyridoxal 5'-phosphate synthase glutaminase subunit PdxT [Actinobacteria bacterium]|nr:pyridoxal 5'-phosphate synthase glutaminase subunit PdxT [Actinomycetota bacterium]MCA1720859.1 pyridoxal 5'-phosphate synthase glutaminase subunit PdxT [Actinomycetota bacterium]
MSAPRVGVLALQGDVREHVRALTEAGAQPAAVRRPEDLAQVDGLVLPGGESTTIGTLLELFGLLEPLRAAVRSGLPVYGSCAGMILLADEVLDGKPGQPTIGGLDISVRRNAFGRQVESFETDLDWPGLSEVHAVFIRAPWVERTGDEVEVLATVPGRPAAGRVVAVRCGPLLATSFHPELTGDARVHGEFVRMVKEANP